MSKKIFAANWKMFLGPHGAKTFLADYLERYVPMEDREVWFFPSSIAVSAVIAQVQDRTDIRVGVQNVYWEPKGAYTGELSIAMAQEAGAVAALVGHSERRHVFGETVDETAKKVFALLDAGLTPMLCVGEKLEERESGQTLAVVTRQLEALEGLDSVALASVPIAYEPVWAIGTGRTATPEDAAEVHSAIRAWFVDRGVEKVAVRVLYGGSVKVDNVRELVAEPEVDGVLVGGASLDPEQWAAISRVLID
jgi:triosephosphate isomerase